MGVNMFTETLNDLILPFCSKTIENQNMRKKEAKNDNPWFNYTCKQKCHEYRNALHNFNVCKSNENRLILVEKKTIYKKT